jgi:hypothetical protein
VHFIGNIAAFSASIIRQGHVLKHSRLLLKHSLLFLMTKINLNVFMLVLRTLCLLSYKHLVNWHLAHWHLAHWHLADWHLANWHLAD